MKPTFFVSLIIFVTSLILLSSCDNQTSYQVNEDKLLKEERTPLISDNYSKLFVKDRDPNTVFMVILSLLGDTIKIGSIPGHGYRLSDQKKIELLMSVDDYEDPGCIVEKVDNYFHLRTVLNLPFARMTSEYVEISDPFYFSQLISMEPSLQIILKDLLGSPDRSWSSLSSSEDILLYHQVLMYLINAEPDYLYSILSNYFELAESLYIEGKSRFSISP